MYEEQLFYENAITPQSVADVSYNINMLHNVLAAGKPVIDIEYVTGAAQVASVKSRAAAAGVGYYIADPDFNLDGADAEGFAIPPDAGSRGYSHQRRSRVGRCWYRRCRVFQADAEQSSESSRHPDLSLNDNGLATYFSGSGTNVLTFQIHCCGRAKHEPPRCHRRETARRRFSGRCGGKCRQFRQLAKELRRARNRGYFANSHDDRHGRWTDGGRRQWQRRCHSVWRQRDAGV